MWVQHGGESRSACCAADAQNALRCGLFCAQCSATVCDGHGKCKRVERLRRHRTDSTARRLAATTVSGGWNGMCWVEFGANDVVHAFDGDACASTLAGFAASAVAYCAGRSAGAGGASAPSCTSVSRERTRPYRSTTQRQRRGLVDLRINRALDSARSGLRSATDEVAAQLSTRMCRRLHVQRGDAPAELCHERIE
jgi:hypothetical protein